MAFGVVTAAIGVAGLAVAAVVAGIAALLVAVSLLLASSLAASIAARLPSHCGGVDEASPSEMVFCAPGAAAVAAADCEASASSSTAAAIVAAFAGRFEFGCADEAVSVALACWLQTATLPFAAARGCALELAEFDATWPCVKRKWKLPVFPIEPVMGAGGGCTACDAGDGAAAVVLAVAFVVGADGVCGALAGTRDAAVGAGAGADGAKALASRSATNGCGSVPALGVDACIRGGDENETVAAKSDAIPGKLDTSEPPQAT